MDLYAEIEIGLQPFRSGQYQVNVRFSTPASAADVTLREGQAPIDPAAFEVLDPAYEEYGDKLTQALFADERVRTIFAQARTQAGDLPLRVRLSIDPGAQELQRLCWETLRDPQSGRPLSTDENTPFSRYLTSPDARPIRIRPRGELQALFAIAAPDNLDTYKLDQVDLPGELDRAEAGLGALLKNRLAGPESDGRATLDGLVDHLRQGHHSRPFDILYLVCHGVFRADESWLILEDEAGQCARVSGSDLARRVRELRERPSLIVLASCESAGDQSGDAMQTLAAQLVAAGIPAVLAMQSRISLPTVAAFMPLFFETLQRTGQVDEAVAAARGRVRDELDHWVPVLFLRLRGGRIWYAPGFSDEKDEFEVWKSLKTFIQTGQCTPILGPALTESLLGSRQEIAIGWADEHGYPLHSFDRDDLPRVAQYIVTRQGPRYLEVIYRRALREMLTYRYPDRLADELIQAKEWTPDLLLEALKSASTTRSDGDPLAPHRILARLELPVYVTTDPGDALENALTAEKRPPVVRLCRWNQDIPVEKCLFEGEPDPKQPLVFHLFGHLSEPKSLVLTEDQFFDYLIGIQDYKESLPGVVNTKLTNNALLFLGFTLEDWYFRVLFRLIRSKQGAGGMAEFSHAVSQIDPDEGRILNAREARRYLAKYFQRENISIYWGTSGDFLTDLWHKVEAEP